MAKKLTKMRAMDPADLDKEELALRGEVWKLRLQLTTGQLQDPSKVRNARRRLAQLMTIRRERELGIERGE